MVLPLRSISDNCRVIVFNDEDVGFDAMLNNVPMECLCKAEIYDTKRTAEPTFPSSGINYFSSACDDELEGC